MTSTTPKSHQPRAAGGRFAPGDGSGKAIHQTSVRTAVFDPAEAARITIPEDSSLGLDLHQSFAASGQAFDTRSPLHDDENHTTNHFP